MANTTKDYAQALDEGTAYLKAIIGDVTPEQIKKKLDDIANVQNMLEELNCVIPGDTNIGIDDDDAELEARIQALKK
ncbi:MAG: hypothetical protein EZS28_005336 [Streblomastix strix]|uniref:Uncharacterized protein n=1 Tax=Streblomastix strix TaxID=222440 RepID=A0A5J4WY22_9EUKA|nr:MAG: hypothetical protein EZS28_005336 [Streblomastix strix]